MPRFICSLPNPGTKGSHRQFMSDDPAALDAWAKREDVPGRSVYDCVNPLIPSATRRALDTVAEVVCLHVDIDFKTVVEDADTVDQRLRQLPLPPTEVRTSGGGRHVFWFLREPIRHDDPDYGPTATLLKRLTHCLGGDPAPAHFAALLRRPGTHNTKYGEPILCQTLWDSGGAVDPGDIVAMLDLLQDTPLLTHKSNGASSANDHVNGEKEPVDVEARLAHMQWQGAGNTGINITQRDCSAKMLHEGIAVEEVVAHILEETRRAVARDPTTDWNWDEEKIRVEGLCYRFINQHHELSHLLPDHLRTKFEKIASEGGDPAVFRPFGLRTWHVRANRSGPGKCRQQGRKDTATGAPAEGMEVPTWPTPYSCRDVSQIPRRKFILGQHYLKGAVSITASPGGVGKSTLSLLDAISLAIGRDLLAGEDLSERRRVWIWNAEDDVDEMERRVVGICTHYNIRRADLVGFLYLDSGYDLPLDLAHGNSKGATLQDKVIAQIAARVAERQIQVMNLDPLVALHTMSEGDNPGHAKLIRTLATRVARPTGCAIDINAHTRKPGAGQDATMSVDDIRGAGAIIYSARSGRILHPMSLSEAEKYGIEANDRLSYYRLERAKANQAKRGTICWVHMVEVAIPNTADGSYGDVVAVPEIWVPPDAMEGITDTIANAIAGEIAKGEFKRDARTGASWAGRLVGLRCGLDIGSKAGKDRAKVILENLIRKGVLRVEIRTDRNRNAREYVVAGGLHGRR
jgi:hypothetical protein